VRFQQIIPQLESGIQSNSSEIIIGIQRISVGFIKKFLLADPVAQLISSSFHVSNIQSGSDILWLCLLYYIRIYMDFSGYSDMAIGIARVFGIRLPENFNYPFLATSLSEFWKRWHISLSAWIRDYIYIPLGGNKASMPKRSINLLIAMGICGLWHGPAWNFVIWGLAHGVGLQISHLLKHVNNQVKTKIPGEKVRLRSIYEAVIVFFGLLLTQVFVAITWLIFFLPIDEVKKVLKILKTSLMGGL
jgi:alginate O-acetyltransferase complex protein AlgI